MPLTAALFGVLGLVVIAVLGVVTSRGALGRPLVYGLSSAANLVLLAIGLHALLAALAPMTTTLPLGLARRTLPARCAERAVPRRRQSRRRGGERLRARLRAPRARAGPRVAVLRGVPGWDESRRPRR
jgi:hypothetical protein